MDILLAQNWHRGRGVRSEVRLEQLQTYEGDVEETEGERRANSSTIHHNVWVIFVTDTLRAALAQGNFTLIMSYSVPALKN